ncbi:calcium/sodium antiporter [Legionella worsleiensis]|uniref:Na/Ca antiporter n=1 Tax=Legionella worsleiensis TaxID=45076 RepID=A0A0W1A3Q6_9GAMM|nr:calcium/sodium antiporter [Legionella worsleiensis]KTD76018.1 Na/Ca antiporter [Legionella worsleiensis]STY33032.1 Ca2 /Na antiporter [Legionella worsleiensis]
MNTILILVISFIALLWAANHLVSGVSGLAIRFKLSPLVIGLTVVAVGTSAPEIAISILSALKDKNNLAIGNAIGANIANIGLVLGITLLIKPNTLHFSTLKKAYPILIITMLFAYGLILDGFLSKTDGCLLLIACVVVISIFIYMANSAPKKDPFFNEFKAAVNLNRSLGTTLLSTALGLIILPVSAKYIILSATTIAQWYGVNEVTIGLTIIALGTTLPELATSITAALKGEEEIAIGTILGSNIYTLLLILAFPALINPAKVSSIILWRDMPVLIALTVLLIFLNYHYKKKLSPWHGGVLILVYCSYITSLILKAGV